MRTLVKAEKKCCSLWLDTEAFRLFQRNTAIIYGKTKSASDKFNEFMYAENLKAAGKEAPLFSYEDLTAERLKWLKVEDKLYNMLKEEFVSKDKTALSTLTQFAIMQGTDRAFEKDIDSVLANLKVYRFKGNEPFNWTILENFIEYLEALLKKRSIEEQIRNYRLAEQNALKLKVKEEAKNKQQEEEPKPDASIYGDDAADAHDLGAVVVSSVAVKIETD